MIKYFSLQSKLNKNINVVSELSICETLDQSIDILKNLFPVSYPQGEYAVDNFISQVEKITSENYMNIDYNISYIADALNISTVYAGNKFKKMFQKTFSTYLSEYRIRIAAAILREYDCKSTELAEKCGFASSSYFIKTFKKYTSMTPMEFRTLQKKQNE